jgi:uncharacterized membrane protein
VTQTRRPRLPPRAPAHWQAALAVLALVGIFGMVVYQLSPRLSAAFVVLTIAVLASVRLARRRQLHGLTRVLALTLVGLVTAALALSVALIIAQLVYPDLMIEWMGTRPSPAGMLATAAVIWLSNVLAFAVWYWEIDAGGPAERHRGTYRSDDLVFPQRQRDFDGDDWVPDFLDYLFFAFNSATAFSPTDTLVMSRRMKVLMMCQSLISLAVLAVVAARAVNALA